MFMLTNSMNILASRASRRRAEEAAALVVRQFVKNECLLIQNQYQIENNTCPAMTFPYVSSDLDFYNKFCDIHYIPKPDLPSFLSAIIVVFCAFGAIISNPIYPFVKFPAPMHERP